MVDAAVPSHWRALGEMARPYRRSLLAMGAVLAASSAITLTLPLLLRAFVDRANRGAPTSALLTIAGAYVGVALFRHASEMGVFALSTALAWRITNDLRVRLADHVLSLDRSFHQRNPPGALVERVDGDLAAVANHSATFALTVVRVVLLAVGSVLVALVLDWRVGLGLAAYTVAAGVVFVRLRDRGTADAAAERGTYGRLFGHIEEHLSGGSDLRANGGGHWAMQRQLADSRATLAASERRERATIGLWHRATAAVVGGMIAALGLGTLGVRQGWITLGTAFALFTFAWYLAAPMWELVEQLEQVQQASGGVTRAVALLAVTGDAPPVGTPGGRTLSAAPAITFEDVSFGYETVVADPAGDGHRRSGGQGAGLVLAGVDLRVSPGERIGLVGRTGAGKTTLARLVLGELAPTSGQVRLDGAPIGDFDPLARGAAIGVVTQDTYIFGASVHDNVTLFADETSDDLVLGALARVGLDNRLGDDRAALDRVLEPGELSAGEEQLLALARILVRDPHLVVLDEATARIDPATEDRIAAAVDVALAGRTAIVIAHRPGTLRVVDRVVEVRRRRLLEHGPPHQRTGSHPDGAVEARP